MLNTSDMDNLKELCSEHPHSAINILLYSSLHISIYLYLCQFRVHLKLVADTSTHSLKYVSIYIINYNSLFVYSTFI